MKSKIIIVLFILIHAHTSIAADKLLSIQQKYGFKMCQKMTSEIKRGSKLICSAKDYKEYLKDGFYDCTLTNKKMGLTVMSYRNKVSDITFYNIFNDTDYGYGIGGKNITPDMVKTQLTKYGLVWSEKRNQQGNTEIHFGKTYTDNVESFRTGPGYITNMVLMPKNVPQKRALSTQEKKTIKYYADFDGLCGDFDNGYAYQFDANNEIQEIKFSSGIP